jgi:hypothetical protein
MRFNDVRVRSDAPLRLTISPTLYLSFVIVCCDVAVVLLFVVRVSVHI